MLPLTQYTEQLALFNAMNFNINVYDRANTTINGTGLSILWCPSDVGQAGSVSDPYTYPNGYDIGVSAGTASPLPEVMRYSSYAGMGGAWFNYQFGNIAPTQQNGVFYAFSVTKLASITDGTSNTVMFGEHTRGIERVEPAGLPSAGANDVTCWHWWTSGNYGDTICTAFWPINPQKRLSYIVYDKTGTPNAVTAVSSMHPGGANIAFCDGSVRFVKETISSWPNSTVAGAYGAPPGMVVTPITNDPGFSNEYVWTPTPNVTRYGVWQQIATRNGGEVVSSDQY
jgi:prepilin-type processing-associated H-X9-DG protein